MNYQKNGEQRAAGARPAGRPLKRKLPVILVLFVLFFIGAEIWERWTWLHMTLSKNKAYAILLW